MSDKPSPAGAPGAAAAFVPPFVPLDADWTRLSPVTLWREWVAKSEAQWSESMSQWLKDPQAAAGLNRQVDEMRLMHRQYAEMAQAALAAANLPARSDFEALDERLGRIEDGLAQVGAELSRLREALAARDAVAAPAALARDRQPPRAKTVAETPPARLRKAAR